MPRDYSRDRSGRTSSSRSVSSSYQRNDVNGRPLDGRSRAYERLRGSEGALVRRRGSSGSGRGSGSGSCPGDEPISRRKLVTAAMGLGMAVGVAALFDYQVLDGEKYRARADARRVTSQILYAKRGTMYDRNGNVLASSVECKNVYVNPKLVKKPKQVIAALVDVLGLDKKTVCSLVKSSQPFVYIKRQVDADDAKKLENMQLAGIGFEEAMKRVYPYGSLASQVLGIVNVDNVGTTGLEKQYEKLLAGTNGSIVRERERDGAYIAGGAYKKTPAKDGADMVLTIDVNIQRVAEEALAQSVQDTNAEYGSAIVTDPATGEILAACSYPTYDPTDLANAKTEDMNLRLVTDAYEPGSVFKTMVCAGGAEMGAIKSDTSFSVPATIKVGDSTVSDDDNRSYGMTMDVREILRRSSNVGMVCVGEAIGESKFNKNVIKRFDIGLRTGVDFPGENSGIVKKRSEYDGSTLGSMSFGQGLSVSPVQVARGVGAIANGGTLKTPHFLKSSSGEEKDWSKKDRSILSSDTCQFITSCMQTVVEEGTGTQAQIDDYDVAGKTGTGEQADDSGGYRKDSFMSSFVGFAPAANPKALCYVALDHTPVHGSQAAIPFKTIMTEALQDLGA